MLQIFFLKSNSVTFRLLIILFALHIMSCNPPPKLKLIQNLESIEITDIDSNSQSVLASISYSNTGIKTLNIKEVNTEFFANGLKIGQKKCNISKSLKGGQTITIPVSIVFYWDDIVIDKQTLTELKFSLFNLTAYAPSLSDTVFVQSFNSDLMSFSGF
jgi:hypothetical protein